ncbi:MAG TPA: SpoIIE family protein phosphatase [Thermoanaerobaculia bacterium]|nr:SpoIIE family protein phosphatase [Thermoanaerobaculia bacterium]
MTPNRPPTALLVLGFAAFLLAALSIVDMYLPRPYDGVVLTETPGSLRVQSVVPDSGADRAGIAAGDRIVGIGRELLRSKAQGAEALNDLEIGATAAYLVRRADGGELEEVAVELGRRQIGGTSYLYACLLGFSFFFIGLFVLLHQPRLRAGHVFFLLCCLFLVFLVCRLRPASYSAVDAFVLRTGTLALVLLPASFLHFFLIFPRPVWDGRLGETFGALRNRRTWATLLGVVYLVPALVFVYGVWGVQGLGRVGRSISGAPAGSWWVLALYMVVGLLLLAANWAHLPASRERRGAAIVLLGSIVGLVPFLVLAVGFPSFFQTEQFIFYGVVPLAAIPLTFAYAIFRFQLLNVRVILRKSLLYTATTAVVTLVYALGIASFNALFQGTGLARSPYFPLLFALAIVLLFEPLRRRIQGPMDRFFFAERARLQRAMVELGEALTGQQDPAQLVRDLVEVLPRLLGLRFAALFVAQDDRFVRAAGSPARPQDGRALDRPPPPGTAAELPAEIVVPEPLLEHLAGRTLARLDDLDLLRLRSPAVDRLASTLAEAGVDAVGLLASSRRRLGLVLLSPKLSQVTLEAEELDLLRGLLHQASIALETGRLLEERARRAELERDLEIAAAIQASLLPRRLDLGPGWRVAAACRPARHVGGDFYSILPGPALLYGDVSGKAVSGALMMMAASEVFHSLALANRSPEDLFDLANRRLYELGERSFVAVGYFSPNGAGEGSTGPEGHLTYLLAGQPSPLLRHGDGRVDELPFPEHRLPLGALRTGGYRPLAVRLETGDLLLAYSDGVVEAQGPDGEPFGQDRLETLLAATPGDPQSVVEAVLAQLDRFTHGELPYDDVTLLAIGRSRPAEIHTP